MSKLAILATLLLAIAVSGCGGNSEQLAAEFQEAINSGDVDTALSFLADEVKLQVEGAPEITGKAQAQDWLESQAGLSFQFEGNPIAIDSGIAFEDCTTSSDIWSYFELGSMTGTCELGLAGSDIASFDIQFDDKSKDRLSESPAASGSDLTGIWTTRNYLADSGDLYIEFLEDGTGRLIGSVGGSIPDHGVEFEGASLMWTYEDFILTIQNVGAASEKYCNEQDVGTFLVKNVGSGGLRFKRLDDTCSLRGVAFQLPPRWRPNVPR